MSRRMAYPVHGTNADLAHFYQLESARQYRRARKAEREVEEYTKASANAADMGSWWELKGKLATDPAEKAECETEARLWRDQVPSWLSLAALSRDDAPRERQYARDSAARARRYAERAAADAARLEAWRAERSETNGSQAS